MFNDYRVVACVPAGRKRTLKPLLQHLQANRDLIDGIQLWDNTKPLNDKTPVSADDVDWLYAQGHDPMTVVVPLDRNERPRRPKQRNTGRFYRNTVDPDTIYIRFDDDIIYVHPDAIRNLLEQRVEHPEPLAMFATIWNNAVVSHHTQQAGLVEGWGPITRYCMDDIAWKTPEFGEYIHRVLLERIPDRVPELYLGHMELSEQQQRYNNPQARPLRMSVSCFAWFGKTMAQWAHTLWSQEEESWITGSYVHQTRNFNRMAGNAIVAHYSFYTQRPHLDTTDILDRYQQIADDTYHNAYYRMMEHPKTYQHTAWWK